MVLHSTGIYYLLPIYQWYNCERAMLVNQTQGAQANWESGSLCHRQIPNDPYLT
jgi:hypothetical protein